MNPLVLQWGSWGTGGGFQDLMRQMESIGIFSLVLPFLLVFAISYAILSKIEVFKENKASSAIISLAIGLLAARLPMVHIFFQELFPRMAVGLAVLMTALILAGAFISGNDDKDMFKWIFFGLGGIIFLFVLFSSLSEWRIVGSGWWRQYGALLIAVGVIIAAIVLIIKFGSD